MEILFSLGNSMLYQQRTGVGEYHYNLISSLQIQADIIFTQDVKINIPNNIKPIRLKGIKKYLYKYLKYFLNNEIFLGRYDMVVSDGWIPFLSRKSKKILIVHDLISYYYPEGYSFLNRVFSKIFFYRIKKVDIIIAVSESTKKDLLESFSIKHNKIFVIPNTSSFFIKRINPKKDFLFFIGDMRKNKNLLNMIKAFECYIQKYQDKKMKFIIAGRKKYDYYSLVKYIKYRNISDRVIFLGYINNEKKKYLYKNCFALYFVSKLEGFGIPLLEAFNSDVPVITGNKSALYEIANNAAICVDADNYHDIANGIFQLFDEDLENIYSINRKIISNKYSIDNFSKKANSVFSYIIMNN